MLRYRLISAIVLIPLVVGALELGGLAFFALVALLILLSGLEFFQMMRRAGYKPLTLLGLALIAIFLLQAFLKIDRTREILTVAIVLTLLAAVFRRSEGWLVGWALTFVGALYIGGLGAYFVLIRDLRDGAIWGGAAVLCTWAMDTAAYIAGTHWGRRGFFTTVSPKKTWEGAIGGWAAAIIAMLIFGFIYDLPLVHSLALGVGIGLAGTFGDLAESVIKRQVGMKDSGTIVPGHGGILDRIDSVLFVAIFVYYYLTLVLQTTSG